MAETLCQLRKKGGGGQKYTETSLWTNPSPSSNFSAQTVNLSDSISNYNYIAIDYKFYTGTSDTDKSRVVYPVAEFKKSLNNSGTNHIAAYFGIQNSSNGVYARRAYYNTDTSIGFLLSWQLGGSNSYSDQAIPLEILGLNELDHGKNFDETTLWTNNAPTSAFAQQSVTLSDDFSNYDYIKINFRNNVGDATASEALISASALTQTNDTFPNLTIRGRYSNTPYVRLVYRASATQITITAGYQMAGTGSSNNAAIPTSIVGCKFK